MKKLLSILTLFIATVTYSQNTVGTLLNTTETVNGYTLFSPRTTITPRYTYLLDNCGEIVNQWESTFPLFSTDYLMPDGSLYRSVIDNQSTLDIPGNTGRIEHLDWEGNLIWGLTYSDTDFSFHHDYQILPNGNILLLVAKRKTLGESLAAGRNPTTIANNELYEESVIEIIPQGSDQFTIVWEWNSWDHLIQDFDDTKDNFGNVGAHPEKVDINYGTNFGEADWWHANALSYSPELDQIIISNRNLDEFIIIDHSTTTAEAATGSGGNSGMGGDIIYRWGNPESYRQGTAADKKLFAQHDVHFIPEGLPDAGKIMIFNNGDDVAFTAIQIIEPPYNASTQNYDYTGGAYLPENPTSQYVDPDNPQEFFAAFLSGAQQLSNGNILICNGPAGFLFEVTPDNETVWEYQSPVASSGILSDGDNPGASQTRVFRALRYEPNYPAFTGRDLTPQGPIELNPVADACEVLDINSFTENKQISLYPTLTTNVVNVLIDSNQRFKATVFSIQGQELLSLENQTQINIENFPNGVYLIKIDVFTDNKSKGQVFKIIKQ